MPSRRRTMQEEEESEEEPTQSTYRRRGRAPASEDESEEGQEEEVGGDGMDVDGAESMDQAVKKLVRYALACEYQRITIKRTGISEKVLGKQPRSFKHVFEAAQKQLRTKFGMEMVELPQRERVTLKAKRSAAKSKGNSKPTASYILSTTLPAQYRTPGILAPSLIGSEEDEATYIGLCTVIVAYISMSPAEAVPEHRLIRALKRLNVDENTPLGKTDAILKKMGAHGYIWKVTDRQGDEETIDYRLGPRGKTEIGKRGVRGFVQEVYGDSAPDDLDKRLNRSLNMDVARIEHVDGTTAIAEEDQGEPDAGPSRVRSSGRRRRAADDDE
ncbi:Non-structural maintenance of chromosome element [Lachnellula subtilissima]|uniref:Non-structural maintenance of chromosome element n=1 Tax=Lachnellula subtilissima TaxID=602034 RepID=A0A8H8UAD2_9HELO|nr:Non-structural maintenance of chromosome element [Lachnellula subtilissima]